MTDRADTRRTFEDLEVGETFEFGPYEMSASRTVEFARRFDPQPMHLDLAGGRISPLGGLSASGWHTAAVLMRLAYDSWLRNVRAMGSPGIDKTEWPRALMAGKSVCGEGRILSMRASRTRPQVGLAQVELSMREPESGAVVLRAVWWMFIGRRRENAPAPSVDGSGTPRHATAKAPSRDGAVRPELKMLYLGGAVTGKAIYLGEASASEEEMIAFAREYDPQPFHLDRRAAEASLFRGLSASGWHTCGLWMRTNVLGAAGAPRGPAGSRAASDGAQRRNRTWFREADLVSARPAGRSAPRVHDPTGIAGKPFPSRLGHRAVAVGHDGRAREPGAPLPPFAPDAEGCVAPAIPRPRTRTPRARWKEVVGPEGIEPSTCRLHPTSTCAAPATAEFVVWTIPSPYPATRDLGGRRLVSTPSPAWGAWLGIAPRPQGFPEFDACSPGSFPPGLPIESRLLYP